MTRNDALYKVLFAIEIALLPMVIFAYLYLPEWSMGLFIAGILLAKIWLELFKDKINYSHIIIDAVGSILVFTTLLTFFMVIDLINVALGVVTLVLIVIMNVFNILYFKKNLPEYVDAVDYCYILFECLTLIAFTFLTYYSLITDIGLFALIMTCAVSIIYKIYYAFKYTKFGNIFRRKK